MIEEEKKEKGERERGRKIGIDCVGKSKGVQ
jgi:hypothetical protein